MMNFDSFSHSHSSVFAFNLIKCKSRKEIFNFWCSIMYVEHSLERQKWESFSEFQVSPHNIFINGFYNETKLGTGNVEKRKVFELKDWLENIEMLTKRGKRRLVKVFLYRYFCQQNKIKKKLFLVSRHDKACLEDFPHWKLFSVNGNCFDMIWKIKEHDWINVFLKRYWIILLSDRSNFYHQFKHFVISNIFFFAFLWKRLRSSNKVKSLYKRTGNFHVHDVREYKSKNMYCIIECS